MTIDEAVVALEAGKIVGIPTDTVYGLAVRPTDRRAVEALFVLKGRPVGRPVALLVASVGQAEEIVVLGPAARQLARRHWPGRSPSSLPQPLLSRPGWATPSG